MYYEEREFDGQWWYRHAPGADWIPFDSNRYVKKIKNLQSENEMLWRDLMFPPDVQIGL